MPNQAQLHEFDWVPIPNKPYIMKYAFSDKDYSIIVSNLTFMYAETQTGFNIKERFSKLNPYAEMKSQVILENIKKSLEKCLNEKSALDMRLAENKLLITLKFPVAHALCNYDIEMDLMTADKVMQYIINPTIFGAVLSQRKVLELKKRISDSTKSSLAVNNSVSLQNIIEPEWLKEQNVPIEAILESFLKLQSYFKELFAENAACSRLKKEKTRKTGPVQSTSPQKKFKLQDDDIDGSTSVKFDDAEQNISIKNENEESNQQSISIKNENEESNQQNISIKNENEESNQSSNTSCESLSQSTKNNVKKKKPFKI